MAATDYAAVGRDRPAQNDGQKQHAQGSSYRTCRAAALPASVMGLSWSRPSPDSSLSACRIITSFLPQWRERALMCRQEPIGCCCDARALPVKWPQSLKTWPLQCPRAAKQDASCKILTVGSVHLSLPEAELCLAWTCHWRVRGHLDWRCCVFVKARRPRRSLSVVICSHHGMKVLMTVHASDVAGVRAL